jgi:hypothetical protein
MSTSYPETEIGDTKENGNKYLEPNVDWDVPFTDFPFLIELNTCLVDLCSPDPLKIFPKCNKLSKQIIFTIRKCF